jgi:hypothetical protein
MQPSLRTAAARPSAVHSAPHHGPGRDNKVGREETLGMLAAVEARSRGRMENLGRLAGHDLDAHRRHRRRHAYTTTRTRIRVPSGPPLAT